MHLFAVQFGVAPGADAHQARYTVLDGVRVLGERISAATPASDREVVIEEVQQLKDVMQTAQSDFVREKAAVDLLNFVERNFEGEMRRGAETEQPAPAPQVNIVMPIMAMPAPSQVSAVTSFTVTRSDGTAALIGEGVEGEISGSSSSEK